jgi:hypothetical protein
MRNILKIYLYYIGLFMHMARLEFYVDELTKKLYYEKYYEAKQREHSLTHREFLRRMMGLR